MVKIKPKCCHHDHSREEKVQKSEFSSIKNQESDKIEIKLLKQRLLDKLQNSNREELKKAASIISRMIHGKRN